jgi:hypothetical protein
MGAPRSFSFTEHPGLWIEGTSKDAGESIKKAVYTFRATHNLSDDSWHVRALGVSGYSIDAWIGTPGQPNYRTPWTIADSDGAGAKVSELLEHLFSRPV